MGNGSAWLAVLLMLVLTVYGQLVLKLRVAALAAGREGGLLSLFATLFKDAWVWSCLAAAFVAGLCWMAALTRLPLTVAYPFVSLTIIAVVVAAAVLLNEPFRLGHAAGVLLVGVGLLLIVNA